MPQVNRMRTLYAFVTHGLDSKTDRVGQSFTSHARNLPVTFVLFTYLGLVLVFLHYFTALAYLDNSLNDIIV